MIGERIRSIGTTVEPDPEEVNWSKKIDEWVAGEIEYDELMEHWPSHNLDPVQKVAKRVSRKVKHLIQKVNR